MERALVCDIVTCSLVRKCYKFFKLHDKKAQKILNVFDQINVKMQRQAGDIKDFYYDVV